jgi:alpha-D-xyloside xylohydrolase
MRGLPMDFPADTDARNISDQFMFGPAFLVNPVLRAMYHWEVVPAAAAGMRDQGIPIRGKMKSDSTLKSRDVYLPKAAGWYDFWTGKKLDGGQKIKADAPIDEMPLFVKAGSIIPMGPFIQYSDEKPADPIELRIYPGADAEFVLYEDENDNYNYEKGVYATIPLKWDDVAETLTIGDRKGDFPGMLKTRTFNIVLVTDNHGTGLPIEQSPDRTITYEGKTLTVDFK